MRPKVHLPCPFLGTLFDFKVAGVISASGCHGIVSNLEGFAVPVSSYLSCLVTLMVLDFDDSESGRVMYLT
jgi:hypothetical protein